MPGCTSLTTGNVQEHESGMTVILLIKEQKVKFKVTLDIQLQVLFPYYIYKALNLRTLILYNKKLFLFPMWPTSS